MKIPSSEEIKQALLVWENKTWEFKSKDALGNPDLMPTKVVDKKDWELAEDIASFANTNGGCIVYGVQDDRKRRFIEGYAISDKLINRISNVIRKRISTVPLYDIVLVKIDDKVVTVFIVIEGDGDLCTVNGHIFVRDVNGKAHATGAEITRIVKKRLGRKLTPTPTKRDIAQSPYILPKIGDIKLAILKDFRQIAPNYGFKLKISSEKTLGLPFTLGNFNYENRDWYFWVLAHDGNFGANNYKQISFLLNWLHRFESIKKGIKQAWLPESAGIYPLVLIMGRINSLRSQLEFFGFSLVPTRYGGYVGPGVRGKIQPLGDVSGHRFLLSGITSKELMSKRIEDFILWLKSNQSELANTKK